MSLCPERKLRSQMSDAEFWEHVFQPYDDPRYDEFAFEIDTEEYELIFSINSYCTECGQSGACGYDSDGRPYIHIEEVTDD